MTKLSNKLHGFFVKKVCNHNFVYSSYFTLKKRICTKCKMHTDYGERFIVQSIGKNTNKSNYFDTLNSH